MRRWNPKRDIPEYVQDGKSDGMAPYAFSMVVAGMSGSGKSYLTETLLKLLASRFPKVYWLTAGKRTRAGLFLPENCVKMSFDTDVLQSIIDENDRVLLMKPKEKERLDYRVAIVFDDFSYSGKLAYRGVLDKLCTYLVTAGCTDLGITSIFLAHKYTSMSPAIREGAVITAILTADRKTIDEAGNTINLHFPSKKHFTDFILRNTTCNTAVIINRHAYLKDRKDGLYIFNAKDHEKEVDDVEALGCPELWLKDPRAKALKKRKAFRAFYAIPKIVLPASVTSSTPSSTPERETECAQDAESSSTTSESKSA